MRNLLASAGTLDDIRAAVCRFYGGDSKTLVPTGDNAWQIIGTYSGKPASGAIVRRVRGRFRFEMAEG